MSNCIFRYVTNAIAPRRDDQVNPTYYNGITVCDNDIAYCDGQAITIGTSGVGKGISVMRNKLYFIGFRQTCRNYSAVPAINVVTAASAEVAGNMVDYCAGTGINTTSGTGSGGTGNQVKVLVHVKLGRLKPEDVAVQIYHGVTDSNGHIQEGQVTRMIYQGSVNGNGLALFEGLIPCTASGQHGFALRVLPNNEDMAEPYEPGMVLWES